MKSLKKNKMRKNLQNISFINIKNYNLNCKMSKKTILKQQ